LAVDPKDGAIWVATGGTLLRFLEGRWQSTYTSRDGLGEGNVADVIVDSDQAVWAATDHGVSRLKNGRFVTLNAANGLPCDTVHTLVEDEDRALWLYMACGLVRISRADLDSWLKTKEKGTSTATVRTTVLENEDGIGSSSSVPPYAPRAAKSGDGRLWLVTLEGVVVVDPRHLPLNTLPPPVHVEQVVADRTRYDASSQLKLPPLVRDLEIQYTALSFVAPEKVQFKIKLEGRDREWTGAGNRRRAFYTDLPPGHYRFRVMAANNSGLWNEQGDSFDFSIEPAYWQTNWFRALCVVAFAALLFGLYRLRVRQLRQRFALTLETRVAERTRIARDLHDTLLQSFHGLLLRFQTVLELMPRRPAEAQAMLASTIDQAADAITEGRDAVQALRTSVAESNNLAAAIRSLGDELKTQQQGEAAVAIRVEVHGVTRALHPIVRDETFRIAGEALRNALHHARATQIEVEVVYDRHQLRLRVRDDGKGIDPQVLTQQGRPGHFGLEGMRERAAVVGGKLTVWSALDAGTEIDLTVPAANAYVAAGDDKASSEEPHESTPAP
jgi:signal transduction histidine kinase